MSTKLFTATLAATALLLSACAAPDGPKQTGGTLLGAGLGALAGSQVGGGTGKLAAVAIGALGGAFLGGEAGKSLDRADRAYAQQTASRGLEYSPAGQSSVWRNPDSGHSGTFTPIRTYEREGRNCREYESTIQIGGQSEKAIGQACRRPDGTWEIVS